MASTTDAGVDFSSPFSDAPSARPSPYTPAELDALNELLSTRTPFEILEWSIDNLPRLYQTTAFGLTGLVSLDIISKISQKRGLSSHPVDLIFIDTLYHFPETIELADRASQKYGAKMHTYLPPAVNNRNQFEALYGNELWRADEDTYDYLVKVEPARRAYEELDVRAVITGRRRSQGGDRAAIPILEVDETGLVKVNPLASWNFAQVKAYVDEHGVPYNALLDRGYKSIGDWHSTKSVDGTVSAAGDIDERSGRWAADKSKTECGLHKDYFKMKKAFQKRQRERELQGQDKSSGDSDSVGAKVDVGLDLRMHQT